jgi:hypothetical protein
MDLIQQKINQLDNIITIIKNNPSQYKAKYKVDVNKFNEPQNTIINGYIEEIEKKIEDLKSAVMINEAISNRLKNSAEEFTKTALERRPEGNKAQEENILRRGILNFKSTGQQLSDMAKKWQSNVDQKKQRDDTDRTRKGLQQAREYRQAQQSRKTGGGYNYDTNDLKINKYWEKFNNKKDIKYLDKISRYINFNYQVGGQTGLVRLNTVFSNIDIILQNINLFNQLYKKVSEYDRLKKELEPEYRKYDGNENILDYVEKKILKINPIERQTSSSSSFRDLV